MLLLTLLTSMIISGETVTIPAQSGRILNYTSVPSTSYKLFLELKCASGPLDCGTWSWTVDVAADGTFSAPPRVIEAIQLKERPQTYALLCGVKVEGQKFIPTIRGHDVGPVDASGADQLKCQSFSAYEFVETDLVLRTASGADAAAWLAGPGRDDRVTLTFGLSSDPAEYKNAGWGFNLGAPEVQTWTHQPYRLMIHYGEYAADAPVDVRVWHSGENKLINTRMNPHLDQMTGPIVVNDAKTQGRPIHRRVDGVYTYGFLNVLDAQRNRVQPTALGQGYASFDARCRDGKIEGSVEFREEVDPGAPTQYKTSLAGECNGDDGVVHFKLPGPTGDLVNVHAAFQKVAALAVTTKNTPEQIEKQWMARAWPVPELSTLEAGLRPRDFRPALPLKDDADAVVGYLYVQTQRNRRR